MHYRDLTPPSETVEAFYAELRALIPRETRRFERAIPLRGLIALRGESPLTPAEAQGVIVRQTANVTGPGYDVDASSWNPHVRRLSPETLLVTVCALELRRMPHDSRAVHYLSVLQRVALAREPGPDPASALARVTDGGRHLGALAQEPLLVQAAREVDRHPERAAQLCLWWALSEGLSAELPERDALKWSAARRMATTEPEFIGHGSVPSALITLRGHIPEWPQLVEISAATDRARTRYHTPRVISEARAGPSLLRHFQQGGRHVLWLCTLDPTFDPVPRRSEPRAPMPQGAALWRAFTWHNRAQAASQLRPLRHRGTP